MVQQTMLKQKEKDNRTRGRVILAATDGACSGNPGPGGWGALIKYEDGSVEEYGGHEKSTTNNRMELRAALETLLLLKDLPRHPDLKLKTDSKYLINGLNQWLEAWKKKGWKTASGKKVLNRDLWESLDKAKLNDVELEYVKGHDGDQDNERVDKIAVCFSKRTYISLNNNTKMKKENFTLNDIGNLEELAPKNLQRLMTRLDMISYIERKKYSITSNEISELLDISLEDIEIKKGSWQWREWLIQPLNNSQWRIIKLNEEKNINIEK